MVQPLTQALPQSGQKLASYFDQLQMELKSLTQNKGQIPGSIKESWHHSWENRHQILNEYKSCLSDLPKELRKRTFIKKTLTEVEDCEKRLKDFFHDMRHTTREEWEQRFEDAKQNTEEKFKDLQFRLKKAQDQLHELEQEPLVQTFLRGETVLGSRRHIQWPRKIGHAAFGLTVLYWVVYSGFSIPTVWTVIGLFVASCFSLEISRHINPKVNQWVCTYFKPVMREAEKNRINSAIFYMVSLLVVYAFCPIQVVILSLLFLAVGDPFAGVIGVYFGKHKISDHASLQGTLAGFAICALMASLYSGYLFETTLNGMSWIVFSLFAGVIGAIAELSFPKLDDNLVIPVVSAPLLWILMISFGIL